MLLKALCLIKLLVIFNIFECSFCYKSSGKQLVNATMLTTTTGIRHRLSLMHEPVTVVTVLTKCDIELKKNANTYYKVLAINNSNSRIVELLLKQTYVYTKWQKGYPIEILSRGDFNVNTCSEITTPHGSCLIDYNACERKLDRTYGGPGLYTKTDHCLILLEKLGYDKSYHEDLQLIKNNQTEGICPLTDLEILLLAPNMSSTSESRKLTTMQLIPVFPLLKAEFDTAHSDYEMIEPIDGSSLHRITKNNTVLEYFADIKNKTSHVAISCLIERVFNVDGEPRTSFHIVDLNKRGFF